VLYRHVDTEMQVITVAWKHHHENGELLVDVQKLTLYTGIYLNFFYPPTRLPILSEPLE
jgi:hypothetical protein